MKSLKSNKSSLSFSALIYFGSNLINGLIPFFFLKILTDYINPAEYGILNIYDLFIFILIPITGFNSGSALSRFYFDKDFNYAKVLYNVLALTLFSLVLLLFVAFVSNNYISDYFNFRPIWVYYLIIFQLVNKVSEYLLVSYQVKEKALQYGIFRIFKTTMDVSFSLLFLVYFEDKLHAKISGQLLGISIAGFVAFYFILKEKLLFFKLDKKYLQNILRYGLPLIPHAIGAFVINLSDRLLIKYYCGDEQVGLYAVGYQIGMVISMFQNSFNQAWVPWFFKQLNKNDKAIKLKIVKYTYLFIIALLALCYLLYLFAPLIFKYIINERYIDAIAFIPFVALGYAFNGMYKMMVNYLFYIKQTKFIGIATFSIAIFNIVLNIILIPKIGAMGAAISTTVSFAIQFCTFAVLALRKYKMPWLLK